MEKFIIVSKKTFDIFCYAKKLDGKEHCHYYEMKDSEGKIRAFFQHGFIVDRYKILSEVPDDFVEEREEDIPKDLFPMKDFWSYSTMNSATDF